jgi:hypothetical protein
VTGGGEQDADDDHPFQGDAAALLGPAARLVKQRAQSSCDPGDPDSPADKIATLEHPPSTQGFQTVLKRTLGAPGGTENAQVETGAPPGA